MLSNQLACHAHTENISQPKPAKREQIQNRVLLVAGRSTYLTPSGARNTAVKCIGAADIRFLNNI